MKKIIYLLLLLTFVAPRVSVSAMVRLTSQEIRYSAPGAREVFLVWGINGWQKPGKELWPTGSFVKDDLLYTPMEYKNGYFSGWLLVPEHTIVDHVFWISKGYRDLPCDIWDLNKAPAKDYHTYALENHISVIESDVKALPKQMISVFDYAVHFFVLALLLLALFVWRYSRIKERLGLLSASNIILSCSFILFVFLLLIRPTVAAIGWDVYADPAHSIKNLLIIGLFDFIFVAVAALVFWLPSLALPGFPRVQKALAYIYALACVLFLCAGLLNIRIVEALGKPFTYQWLYYSDFLKSADAQVAIASNIQTEYVVRFILIICAALIFALLLVQINRMLWSRSRAKIIGIAALNTVGCCYLVYAGANMDSKKWDYNKIANPVAAFLESTNPFTAAPELFTMEVPDSLRYNISNAVHKPLDKPSARFKNVIFFVLESTPAEYISSYGSRYPVTPELNKYLSNALVFENIYAHAPATNNSMVSLLASVYPQISYVTLTQEYPGIVLPTISSELKHAGYRTGFFNSADNRFQRAEEFLSYRKFDVVNDCRDETQFHVDFEDNDFLNGKSDQTTAEQMMAWIAQSPQAPFFAMLWTYQTHYPYFSSGPEIDYGVKDPVFNRYLNAVYSSDKAFGSLMEFLKEQGLYESTLVVLVGDHGEAFGRHDQTTHATRLYEENLHVPCIFINPAFEKQKISSLGGLVDIAPTVLGMLKAPLPGKWQGKDLFVSRNKRVYFFSPWSDYLFGYREGTKKFIFNATRNLTEIYDLRNDPYETQNLYGKINCNARICHQRIAGWIQWVNQKMHENIKGEY